MRKWLIRTILATTFLVTGCTDQAIYLDNLHKSASPTPTVTPSLSEANSSVACIELETTGTPWLASQGEIQILRINYQVAVFTCANSSTESGVQFVESFVFDQGVWASNGLVSGTDEPFQLTGSCVSGAEKISCPARVGTQTGQLDIFNLDGGPGWLFRAT